MIKMTINGEKRIEGWKAKIKNEDHDLPTETKEEEGRGGSECV